MWLSAKTLGPVPMTAGKKGREHVNGTHPRDAPCGRQLSCDLRVFCAKSTHEVVRGKGKSPFFKILHKTE